MKCIKSIKATKNTELGVMKRVDDSEAESKVVSGYWSYISKKEYKDNGGVFESVSTKKEVVEKPKKKRGKK